MRGKALLLRRRARAPGAAKSSRSAASPRSITRERRLEPDDVRVLAQQPIADRVKRAGPQQARRIGVASARRRCAQRLRAMRSRPTEHLLRRAARERQQQDAFGRDALEQQMRDAMRERVGLAGAGAGDDEQRPGRKAGAARRAVSGSRVLGGIQALGRTRSAGASWIVRVHERAIMAQNCIKRQKSDRRRSRALRHAQHATLQKLRALITMRIAALARSARIAGSAQSLLKPTPPSRAIRAGHLIDVDERQGPRRPGDRRARRSDRERSAPPTP